MLDCQSFGVNPGLHHFSSVVIHALAAIALFLTLDSLTAKIWRSAFVAAVFAIHPLGAESVPWIVERKDVLSGLFFALTLLAWSNHACRKSLARYLIALLAAALGTLSQIDAVHDSVRAFAKRLLAAESFSKRENHFADSGKDSFCAIRRSLGGCDGAGPTRQIDTFGFSLPLRFENAIVSYAIYLRQLIWSIDLAVLYPHPEKFFPFPIIAGCIALLMALSAIAIIYRNDPRFRSPAGFGLLACWSR